MLASKMISISSGIARPCVKTTDRTNTHYVVNIVDNCYFNVAMDPLLEAISAQNNGFKWDESAYN